MLENINLESKKSDIKSFILIYITNTSKERTPKCMFILLYYVLYQRLTRPVGIYKKNLSFYNKKKITF